MHTHILQAIVFFFLGGGGGGGDLAHMQLISNYNKGFRFLLRVIDI